MKFITCGLLAFLPLTLLAQEPNPMQSIGQNSQAAPSNSAPLFKVQVVSASVPAITYRDRSGWTKIGFDGTSLAPKAKGGAQVRGELGHLTIKFDVKDLPAARTFGPLYLTYVLWAITPDGHPSNLAEVVVGPNGGYSGTVTTDLQSFGLIITAEPYFDVHQPSNVVVMQNFVLPDTLGKIGTVNAKFELLPRGMYTYHVAETQLKPVDLNSNKKSPLELYEAQNAIQIAEYAKANEYASDVYQSAETLWHQAQDYEARKQWKPAIMTAREAVEKAEDARIVSLRKQQQLAEEHAREEAAARQAAAQQQAEEAAARAQQAQQQAQQEAAQRAAAEQAQAQAAAEAQKAQNEALKAQQAADEANRLRAEAEQQKEQLRQQLLQQFNAVLPTRETPRGLVINLQDVLFATGKYELTQPAQLALARLSGIIVSHPGLNLRVEGYTDSTGSEAFNQKLSEERADTVRNFLIQQGLNPQNIAAIGYGESYPVASNDTAAGRQLNRRVELVVSGEVIGVKIGVPPQQSAQMTPNAQPAPTPLTGNPPQQ
jgi:outer membrane protein OmpA-like peptidoglycan-associated protein